MKKKLLALGLAASLMLTLAACGGSSSSSGAASDTQTSGSGDSEGGGYKIAFSNSYVGNAWRTASVNIFDAYTADLVEQGVLSKAYSSSAGDDVQAQINEIRKKMCPVHTMSFRRADRTAVGHEVEVRYIAGIGICR